MLFARLFGYFSLADGDRLLPLPTDKARALLALLLVEHRRPQPRSRLAGLLWPDLPERRGLHNLTNALVALRRIGAEAQCELLLDTSQAIAVNPAAIDCDLWQIEQLLERSQAHQHRSASTCPSCAARTDQVLTLLRDQLLLELELDGCDAYGVWQQQLRDSWHDRSIELRKQQAAFLAACGRFSEARTLLLSILRNEPWREEVLREVMTLSAALGERSTALRQYQRGIDTLRRHLNADPEPVTSRLAEAISNNRLPTVTPPWRSLPEHPTAFFGRAAELAELSELLCDRQVRLLTLLGPGGIGKTYLASAAARQVAVAFSGGTAYVALAEADDAAAAVLRIAAAVGIELTPMVPPLAQLQRFLAERPWLLVLDNLEQIADADTLISRLLDGEHDLVVLATSRRSLGLHRERIYTVNGFSVAAFADNAVDAPQPDDEDALAFMQQRAAAVVPHVVLRDQHAALRELCRLSGGLPLALEMVIAQLAEHRAAELVAELQRELAVLQRRAPDVPERHHQISVVFQQSWLSLQPDQRELLSLLTLCRSPFDTVTVAAVSANPAPQPLLNNLRAHGLVLPGSADRHDLHPLLRQFVEQTQSLDPAVLEAARLRHQHHFLALLDAEALQQPDERTLPYVQAHAAQFSDIRAALQFAAQQQDSPALIAALPGLQQFCMFLGWYDLGLQLIEEATAQIAAADPETAAGLLLRAGILAMHAGRRDHVTPLSERALAWHRDAVTEIQAGSLVATLMTELRNFNGAIAEFEQLRARRVDLPTDVAAYLTYSHSRVLMFAGRLDEAEAAALESRDFALAAGDVRTLALVDSTLAQIPARAGNNLRALPRFEQALQSGRRLGLSFVLWVTLGNYAHTLAHAGREPEYTRALLTEWEEMTRASRDELRLALLLLSSVTTYLEIGDVDRAELQLCSSLPLMRRIPHPELDRLLLEAVSQLGRERGLHAIVTEALRIQLGHPETQPASRELARRQLDPAIEPYNEPVDALNLRVRSLFQATAAAFNVTFT